MTTYQRLRALVKGWRQIDETLPPDITGPTRSAMLLAACCCADDLQEVIDEIREQRKRAGQIGGSKSTPEKTRSNRRNASLPRKRAAE